jgi:hypothetical protein
MDGGGEEDDGVAAPAVHQGTARSSQHMLSQNKTGRLPGRGTADVGRGCRVASSVFAKHRKLSAREAVRVNSISLRIQYGY